MLFDWDNYFAAYMAAIDNKDLAYANAVEMTREKTESGFIPNFATVADIKSRDRSEPPVGSLMVREIYRIFGDNWFLEEIFDDLFEWNHQRFHSKRSLKVASINHFSGYLLYTSLTMMLPTGG